MSLTLVTMRESMKLRLAKACLVAVPALLWALLATRLHLSAAPQEQKKSQTPPIGEYQPKSTLVTKEHRVERAKFPFIDIHSHHGNPTAEEVDRLVKEMDTIN